MKVSSLICEYNPFHNGHKYMLDKMRENGSDFIIACMSGNFTQRGDFAGELRKLMIALAVQKPLSKTVLI